MDYTTLQINHLRSEITALVSQTLYGALILGALAVLSYVVAVSLSKRELYRLTVILILNIPLWAARQDYIIHRNASWIKMAEREMISGHAGAASAKNTATLPTWEEWKGRLSSRKTVLPLIDLLAGLGLIWIFTHAQTVLFKQGDKKFVWTTCLLLIGAIALIPISIYLADW
jgi:hypothetical protein